MAFKSKDIESTIRLSKENDFLLEFSSGLPYHPAAETLYLETPIKKIIHNYFPAPKDPFVINLASADNNILKRSLGHCIRNIELSKLGESPFYAAHAGFCLDPKPDDLGASLSIPSKIDIQEHQKIFRKSLKILESHSSNNSVLFLFENNVLSKQNFKDLINPLLCVSGDQIVNTLTEFRESPYLGLLLDTGHFKVSCNTLGLDIKTELEKIKPFVKAIHHSDNDGLRDTNQALTKDYWFLEYIKSFKTIPHVIEVRDLTSNQIINHIKLLNEASY